MKKKILILSILVLGFFAYFNEENSIAFDFEIVDDFILSQNIERPKDTNVSSEAVEYTIDLSNPPIESIPGVTYANNMYTFDASAVGNNYTFTGTTTTDRIIIPADIGTTATPLSITLDGVTMDTYNAPITILDRSVVQITLTDGSVNKTNCTGADGDLGSGIHVNSTAELIINGDTGILNAYSAYGSAAIGNGNGSKAGKITINGGHINAYGGDDGAGIGSGYGAQCGTIIINGGYVYAVGGGAAAAIGVSKNGTWVGDIQISSDAFVLATSTGEANYPIVGDSDNANTATTPANIVNFSPNYESVGTLKVFDSSGNPIILANGTNEIQLSETATCAAFSTGTYKGKVHIELWRDGEIVGTYLTSNNFLSSNTNYTRVLLQLNYSPELLTSSYVTDEDTVYNDVITATDTEANTLTYSVAVNPTNGVVTIDPATGAFTYTPNENFTGSDSFDIKVTDGFSSVTTTFNITINPVNDAPVATDITLNTNEDTSVESVFVGNDVDNSTLTYSIESFPTTGSAIITDASSGTFTYTPSDNFAGTTSFMYSVSDGLVTSNIATVTIDIVEVNDAPNANDVTINSDEDTTVNDLLTGSDLESDPLTYTIDTSSISPETGTVTLDNASSGAFTYMPATNFNGTSTFNYTVSDGTDTSNVGTVTINVAPIDDDPVANDNNFSTYEDTILNETILTGEPSTDVDGDNTTISVESQPTNGNVIVNSDGSFTYTPNSKFVGTDSFTYSVNDGNATGTDAIGTVWIEVLEIGDAPVASNVNITTDEDLVVNGNMNAIDGDTPVLTYEIDMTSVTPQSGSVTLDDPTTGAFTYTPAPNFNGITTFTYTATDGVSVSNTATVTINVAAIDDEPIVIDDSYVTDEDTAITSVINTGENGVDVDGETLTFSVVSAPTNGTLVLEESGNFTYTPAGNYTGTDSFTYEILDGNTTGLNQTGTINIQINPVNDVPKVEDSVHSTYEEVSIDGVVVGSDVENSSLTYSISVEPLNGVVILDSTTGAFTYTPNTDFIGTDTFNVIANDGNANSLEATITIEVLDDTVPPITESDSFTTAEDIVLNGSVAGNDINELTASNGLTYSSGSTSSYGGTVTMDTNGNFTYIPPKDFNGVDTFTYIATDISNIASIETTVSIEVTAVNDAPVSNEDTFVTSGTNSINGSVAINDSDVDQGDIITYSVVSTTVNGTLVFNSDGTFTYTPDVGFTGEDTFTYVATDSQGMKSEEITVSISVSNTNAAPNANDDSEVIIVNNQLLGNVYSNDTDENGDMLTYELVTAPEFGKVVFNSDGTYTYTPNEGFIGNDQFVYSVTDGEYIDTAIVSIEVVEAESSLPSSTDDSTISSVADEEVQNSGQTLEDTGTAPYILILSATLFILFFVMYLKKRNNL